MATITKADWNLLLLFPKLDYSLSGLPRRKVQHTLCVCSHSNPAFCLPKYNCQKFILLSLLV